jgi:hypothetical protein
MSDTAVQHVNSIRELTHANLTAESHFLQQQMLGEYQKENASHLHKSSNELDELINPSHHLNKHHNATNSVPSEDQSLKDSSLVIATTAALALASATSETDLALPDTTLPVLQEQIQSNKDSTPDDQNKLTQPSTTRNSENDWVLF